MAKTSIPPFADISKLKPGQQQSGTYFQQPNVVKALTNLMGGVAEQTGSQYADFINNPTGSPIYQNALGGLLGSLVPGENASRMALNDQFRAAGNTASSSYGHAAAGLESDIMRNRSETASKLLTTLFPQVTDALYKPLASTPSLIDATKLQQAQGVANKATDTGGSMGGGPAGYMYNDTGIGAQRGGAGTLVPQYKMTSGPAA